MKTRQQGMTLVELITAMLVLAILVGMAVPTFREFAQDSRTQSASSDLTTALAIARSEAIRGSHRAVVCGTVNGTSCADDTEWTTGWLVFADRNNNDVLDATELVQVWPPLSNQVRALSTVTRATYNGMGMALGAATFRVAGTACAGDRVRVTSLTVSGSMTTRKATCPI